ERVPFRACSLMHGLNDLTYKRIVEPYRVVVVVDIHHLRLSKASRQLGRAKIVGRTRVAGSIEIMTPHQVKEDKFVLSIGGEYLAQRGQEGGIEISTCAAEVIVAKRLPRPNLRRSRG